ncbi:MAG TPA: hypothetical protein VHN78_13660, partial [Chloroflexota bacterium]|nr:hypothetical protein [Chloroflexota bacterium]
MAVTSEPRAAAPTVVAWFEAAASYLNRARPACPQHGVRHTAKLARSIVLDLALLDATGEARHWERAVRRADDTTSRLAPDPDHGGLIYFPGRLDPRNCSNSIIDSGECTDAVARLLLHPRADTLDAGRRASFTAAVEQNAETYLA